MIKTLTAHLPNPYNLKSSSSRPSSPPAYDAADQVTLQFNTARESSDLCSKWSKRSMAMLMTSEEELKQASTVVDLEVSRGLYLTGVDYLLRGVPSQLAANEKEALAYSILALVERTGIELCPANPQVVVSPNPTSSTDRQDDLFVVVCKTSASALKLAIPKVQNILEKAIQYENEYHIAQKSSVALKHSILLAMAAAEKWNLGSSLARLVTRVSVGIVEGYKVLAEDEKLHVPISDASVPLSV